MKQILFLAALAGLTSSCHAQNALAPAPVAMPMAAPPETEATLYSTMPSMRANRAELAMDGDQNSYYKTVYGMGDGDDFTVLFSRPLPVRSMTITTGNADGDNLLTKGYVEVSTDGKTYKRAATFDSKGVATGNLNNQAIMALRIKINAGTGLASLIIREITLDSPTKISHVQWGAGRPFEGNEVPANLKVWAAKADKQMMEFWPEMEAVLYTDNFITPNKVNIFYRTGPNVTGVAATGGGEMTVNTAWAGAHPDDTGLTVHEVAHVVQAMSAYNPVWLIEGTADYLRWVKFEPQNFTYNITDKSNYNDSYRTTGAFLAWCELHYDSRLVTKLNADTRFGRYTPEKWKEYTGKDAPTLWQEFLAAYKADPKGVITPPVALADRPRELPVVAPNSSVAVDLSKTFNALGFVKAGSVFGADKGFDGGGAAFSSQDVGAMVTSKNVNFKLGTPGVNNIVTANGATVNLPSGKYASLWMLGAAVEGGQRAQEFVVNYADGTKQTLVQNFSDWYAPQSFPGETRAIKTEGRVMMDGTNDPRSFSMYSYGFALDANKTVQSLTLPNNPNVKIAGISLAK